MNGLHAWMMWSLHVGQPYAVIAQVWNRLRQTRTTLQTCQLTTQEPCAPLSEGYGESEARLPESVGCSRLLSGYYGNRHPKYALFTQSTSERLSAAYVLLGRANVAGRTCVETADSSHLVS